MNHTSYLAHKFIPEEIVLPHELVRQFRAEVDDGLYKDIQVATAHVEAETNAELLQRLIDEVEYER